MDIPADSVPPELKTTCEQILKRARELRKVDPVMSYWCCFSAATASMKVSSKRSDESMKFLLNLVTVLEDMKKSLLTPDSGIEHTTITEESAGSAYVEDFAMKVFIQADDEDRAGKSSKHLIRKFVVASQFLEVLRCFEPPNGMREELEQKQQYAKWKATDIAKALREGRKPTPGPPVADEFEDLTLDHPGLAGPSFPTVPSETSSPQASNALPIFPSSTPLHLHTPDRPDSTGSGAWSTVATPGLRESEEPEVPTFDTPAISDSVGLPEPGDVHHGGDDHEPLKKGVRFVGPDGAPLSPASTLVTLDSYAAPEGPPPSEFDENHGPPPPPVTASPPLVPPPTAHVKPTQMPSAPVLPPPSSAATHPTPSAPPLVQQAPIPQSQPLPQSLDSKSIEKCQKHAKWAVSALDYEDLDTARDELKKALALLGVQV